MRVESYLHRRRKVLIFFGGEGKRSARGRGEGGGARLRILGGNGAKLLAGCKLIGAPAPDQCQIITFFSLKTDNMAKLRKELKVYFQRYLQII